MFDGATFEEVAVVFEEGAESLGPFDQHQGEVETGGFVVDRRQGPVQPRAAFQAFLAEGAFVVQHKGDLENRGVAGIALRMQLVDQLFEGKVLVVVGVEHGLAGAGEQLFEADVVFRPEAQHQGIGEKTDQPFDLRAMAAGNRRADDQILLIAKPTEEPAPGGEEGHEEATAMAPAKIAEAAAELPIDFKRHPAAPLAAHLRPRMIERQLQQPGSSLQVPPPEVELAVQRFSRQHLGLPSRKIGVLQGERRQR